MKVTILLIFTLVVAKVESAFAQRAELIKIHTLQRLINNKDAKIKVINFWATWCGPCVKEIPLFEKLNQKRNDVTVALISIDIDLDPNPDKVWKFVDRKNIHSRVYILDERNANTWIDSVDKTWSGALPATLIVNPNTGKRRFVERELHEGEIEKLIDETK